jgi:hypothetical protein
MKSEDYEFLHKCNWCDGRNTVWIWFPTKIGIRCRCTEHTIIEKDVEIKNDY